jgi:DNA-directed RNA polymerase I, II, and III subunit RPABC4
MDNRQQAASKPHPMIYICGECREETEIRPKDAICCRQCGFRILYKKRCRKLMVYDAR